MIGSGVKTRSLYLGREGLVGQKQKPDWSFLYQASTVKDTAWNVGDRVVLPDGRVFRYGKFGESINVAGRGVFNANLIPGIITTNGYEGNLSVAAAAGDCVVKIADTTVRAEDFYAGGILNVFVSATHIYPFGIVSSQAGTGTYVQLTLDAALPEAVTTAMSLTAYTSPYNNLKQTGATGGFACCMGIPLCHATSGQYGWIQTWGPIWVTATAWGSTGPGCAANLRDVYVHTDGTIMPIIDSSGVAKQRIGTVLYMGDGTAYGDGIIMLQISP